MGRTIQQIGAMITGIGLAKSAVGSLRTGFSQLSGGNILSGLASIVGGIGGIVGAAQAAVAVVTSLWSGLRRLFGGGEEGVVVNPARDRFIGQYGGDTAMGERILQAYMAGGASYDEAEAARIELMDRGLFAARSKEDFDRAQDAIIDLIGGQRFAKGGLVLKPLIGMVGEKGPEAIIPLDKMPSIFNRPIEVTVINQMDGMTVARVVQRHWSRSLSHAGLGVG
jgi:hypothetical protein